jgi:tetratricopeptide (TPR) repeat protein
MREDAAASDTDAALAQAIRARRLLASGFSDAHANALHRALRPAVLGETPYLRSSCFSELGAHYHRTGNISDMIRAFQDGFNVLLEQGSAHAVTCEAQTVLASAKLASVDWCESAVVDMLSVFERLATQDISSPRAYAYMIFAYVNKTILNYSAAREYASRSALECQPFSDARAAAILSGAARIEAALGDPDTALEWAERARRNAPELPMIELRAADVASHIPRIGPVHVHQRSSGGCAQHAHYDGSRLLIEARSERADKRRRSALLRDALSGLRRGAPLHELHDALDLLTAEGQIASAERQERREMLEIFKNLRSKYSAELPRPLAHSA